MSDTILSGRWVVYYEADNRQKRIARDTSVTPTVTDTVNALYSAVQDLFDELNQMDDGSPMSAQTPTEYTIGIIDAGDDDPWFIDRESVEYLTGGALKTASWTRSAGTDTGIVRVDYTVGGGSQFVASDIGKTVTHTDGDSGTLLDYETGSSVCWIRPDSNAAANNWDSAAGTITVTGGTGSVTQNGASSTGESLWSNIFTIGTIQANTHIYVEQAGSLLTGYKTTTDWWGDGQIDILINTKEVDVESDEGVIRVFARQYSKTYSHFEVDLTAGGRNPIPLSTGNDLDNQSGYREMVLTTVTTGFAVGDVITDDSDSTIQGVVTSVSGSVPNQTIQYYLIGDPLNDFTGATGAFTGQPSTATATAVAPTNVGPANLSPVPTVVHSANETFDIDEDGTTENYSIVVDAQSTHSLATIYQWLKYITRRGGTTTTDTDGIEGQFYIGSDYYIGYGTLTGTVSEGAVVTQLVSGATGTVVAHNTTDNYLILRNSRGTFDGTNNVEVDGSNYVATPSPTVITPVAAAPFGTFAGGKFFAARGVVFDNALAADLNNYQLIEDGGTVVTAPIKVNVTVGNTRALDRVAVFRTASGVIEKDYYAISGTPALGATTFDVSPTIRVDEPGKTTGGVVRVVDTSANYEHRYRFSSWSGSTITLANSTGTADAGGSQTTLIDAAGSFNTNAKVGDLIRNTTEGTYAYVVSVDSDTQLTTTNTGSESPVTDWGTGDGWSLNSTVAAYVSSDDVYIPIVDAHETTGTGGSPGSETVQIVYDADMSVLVRARQAGAILPYSATGTVTSSGLTNNVIRTADTIFT